MERVVKRPRELIGRNASERRAGLETENVEADPPQKRGRPTSLGNWGSHPEKRSDPAVPPGYWRRHASRGDPTRHGKPQAVRANDSQPDAREGQAEPTGW